MYKHFFSNLPNKYGLLEVVAYCSLIMRIEVNFLFAEVTGIVVMFHFILDDDGPCMHHRHQSYDITSKQ